mgnify:CR=1 FL=1
MPDFFVPGMRLPTYVGAGMAKASLWRFAVLAVGASLAWTFLLLSATVRLGEAVLPLLGRYRWPAAAAALAARWAAKEAVSKVLGLGVRGVGWREIEIIRLPTGAPMCRLHDRALVRANQLGMERIAVSISHEREYAVAIAFGIRNVTFIDRALAEIARVLRPGGRMLCLEFSRPWAPIRPFYQLFSATVIPRLGAWVSRNPDAYRYLVESIQRFPDQEEMKSLM